MLETLLVQQHFHKNTTFLTQKLKYPRFKIQNPQKLKKFIEDYYFMLNRIDNFSRKYSLYLEN